MPDTSPFAQLVAQWRHQAVQFRRYAPEIANLMEDHALELEDALRAAAAEPISPSQAEAEGICDAETVRRAVREGRATNVGTPGRIRVPRNQVPRGRNRKRASFEEIARAAVRPSSRR